MLSTLHLFIVVLGLLPAATPSQLPAAGQRIAPEPDFYDLRLENLAAYSFFKTEALRGRPSLWVLFQPDCASCKAQFADLGCLPPEVERIALGIRGSRDELKRSLRWTDFRGRRLAASPELEKRLNASATPTLFLVDTRGQARRTLRGVTPCARLKAEFLDLQRPN